ncbi:hypothetical protein BH24CHL7_BH24CHL7_04880 [soil metagenome]
MSFQSLPLSIALLAATALFAACGTAPAAPTAAPASPTAPPAVSPSPTAPAAVSPSPSGAVVVTFQVEDEQYRILLTDADDIAVAQRLLAGEEAPSIPNGLIVRGDPGVNTGYSWHIDPASVEFADMTIELCDGLPSFVEDGTLEGDRFCPWGAGVVDIQPAD